MDSLTLLPKYQVFGLYFGFLKKKDVENWMNSRILEIDEPSDALLDFAYHTDVGDNIKTYHLLLEIENTGSYVEIIKFFLSRIPSQKLNNIGYCISLAKRFKNFYKHYDVHLPESIGIDDEHFPDELIEIGEFEEVFSAIGAGRLNSSRTQKVVHENFKWSISKFR